MTKKELQQQYEDITQDTKETLQREIRCLIRQLNNVLLQLEYRPPHFINLSDIYYSVLKDLTRYNTLMQLRDRLDAHWTTPKEEQK